MPCLQACVRFTIEIFSLMYFFGLSQGGFWADAVLACSEGRAMELWSFFYYDDLFRDFCFFVWVICISYGMGVGGRIGGLSFRCWGM